jgi:hypothetical protein
VRKWDLTYVALPAGMRAIGNSAFSECSGLKQLEIPSSVTTIGNSAFSRCSGLTQLRFPSSLTCLGGKGVFEGVTKLERLRLVGSVLSPAVVEALEGCLTPTAVVIGPALIGHESGSLMVGGGRLGRCTPGGGKFGRFTIVAA